MIISFDEQRPSDSPFVERIWRCHSERGGPFISMAESRWEIVVTRLQGMLTLTVRGPETVATEIDCPPEGEWLGIRFKLGTVMPRLPASGLVDGDVNLPNASRNRFWLYGSAWQFPNFENADTFVDRLVRRDLLVRDPVVADALQEEPVSPSLRTVRRHFQKRIGLTPGTVRQIERARYATILLLEGLAHLEVAHRAGYYDQPHMTRSIRHFIGLTPSQLQDRNRSQQLSFLYPTEPPA